MRPGVRSAELEPLRKLLCQFRLQGVIVGVSIGSRDIRHGKIESRLEGGFTNRNGHADLGYPAIEHTGADSSLRIAWIATAIRKCTSSFARGNCLLNKREVRRHRVYRP